MRRCVQVSQIEALTPHCVPVVSAVGDEFPVLGGIGGVCSGKGGLRPGLPRDRRRSGACACVHGDFQDVGGLGDSGALTGHPLQLTQLSRADGAGPTDVLLAGQHAAFGLAAARRRCLRPAVRAARLPSGRENDVRAPPGCRRASRDRGSPDPEPVQIAEPIEPGPEQRPPVVDVMFGSPVVRLVSGSTQWASAGKNERPLAVASHRALR
jgi:hypothetical protein